MRFGFVLLAVILTYVAYGQKAPKEGLIGYDKIGVYNKKGWAKVEKATKVGYIDRSGTEVIECIYDEIFPFEKGRAKVLKNGKFGLVNEAGEVYVEPKYDYIGPFINGLAIITVKTKRGLLNEAGEEIVEVK